MTGCSQAAVVTEWAQRGSDAPLDAGVAQHLEKCPACHELFHEIGLTRRIASDLPTHEMSGAARDEFRFRLMAEARRRTERPRYSWPVTRGALLLRHRLLLVAAGAAAVVLAVAGWLAMWPPGASPDAVSAANVVLLPGAQGTVERGPPDEIYRLSRGTADFTVRKVAKDQRYRVLAGDGTVEVRGTRFRLEVVDGRLEGVEVTEGRVWVWLGTTRVADILKGERWTRGKEALSSPSAPPSASAESAERPALPVSPAPASASPSPTGQRTEPQPVEREAPRIAPSSESAVREPAALPSSSSSKPSAPDDSAFAHAWDLLRRGEALRAAGEFDAMLDSGTLDAARRADVLYWSAQAYSRAGRPATAESRARRLVSEFASSFRAADAALMLGEMTLARGERAEARQWFRRAAGSTHPSVRARAEKGLSELGPER